MINTESEGDAVMKAMKLRQVPECRSTPKPAHVNLAERGEEQAVFDLLKLLDDENGIFERDDEEVMATIKKATMGLGGMIGVIKHDGRIVGAVGLFLGKYWYTKQWHLEEYWMFVHPDYRRSDYAKDLIDYAKWANENLGVLLITGVMSRKSTAAKVKLYARRLIPLGAFFANGLPDGAAPHIRHFLDETPDMGRA